VDSKTPEEEIPYKIYPLENSSPQHVAGLLEQLIQKKTEDKEGKIKETPRVPTRPEEQITIVPDPNTFSLIVYANRKNQEWIEKLTKSLDKRRPQVLIDVTLVEITRTDTFEYDLNLVAGVKEAVIGNIGIEPIHRIDSLSRLEGSFNLLDTEGNPTGQTRAFYSDKHVQALLTAIKRKNYGRVLAKPKILVDDGQEGKISTTEETTYVKETIQVPDQGAPITTRDFEAIEASIELKITPHISEGDLLRLDVHLSREDFGSRPTAGAPPDKATSEITTTVFVPDNKTVILGGLVKLNQSKGGSKVPILGDIPLIGALFRSVDNSDVEKKLYVFLKANIVRPYDEGELMDLQKISKQYREQFEQSEAQFQEHENIPGIKPAPMQPERVLEGL
jgi:type II secretory pathway component GspD/PulD (secretin)